MGDMGGGTGDVDRDLVGLPVEIVRAGMTVMEMPRGAPSVLFARRKGVNGGLCTQSKVDLARSSCEHAARSLSRCAVTAEMDAGAIAGPRCRDLGLQATGQTNTSKRANYPFEITRTWVSSSSSHAWCWC
jgi:hypothetical protein